MVFRYLLRSAFFPKAVVGRNWQTARENFRIDLGEEFRAHYDAPFIHVHRADLLDLLSSVCRPGSATLARDVPA
ncbi:hypothetical protein [Brucella pituitosa]|uniref:hypothetical protein n=1 Tax=Brucella pituitosa TaxID=571256 RepID=UPI0020929FAA|nr:hypothetical protein [Brucella pituitosa]